MTAEERAKPLYGHLWASRVGEGDEVHIDNIATCNHCVYLLCGLGSPTGESGALVLVYSTLR